MANKRFLQAFFLQLMKKSLVISKALVNILISANVSVFTVYNNKLKMATVANFLRVMSLRQVSSLSKCIIFRSCLLSILVLFKPGLLCK